MSCESTSSLIIKLWEKYGDEAKKFGCAVASTATASPELIVECIDAANKAEEMAKKVISFWNTTIAGNSWAHLGPRQLAVGETETGTLQSVGDRTFITPLPLNCEKVKLHLIETDGKGETQVEVCKMDVNGKCKKIKTYNFNDDAAGKRGQGNVELEIDHVKGKYIVVLLNGKSALKKFEYSISLKKVREVHATVS